MKKSLEVILGITVLITLLFIMMSSCKKDDTLPDNPYDDVDYGTGNQYVDTVDPSSIIGLQRNIFSTKCANPGCHDGFFEPDFRTVQSTYATLVYHKIVKNNANEDFTFRVVPYDTAMSVLYERITNCCFVNQDDRMPQDNIGVPLPQSDIDNIAAWIMNGARDMAGQVPTFPNSAATVLYFAALSADYQTTYSETENRIDSVEYNPFYAPKDASMIIAHVVEDDSTAVKDLTVNTLKLSLDMDDFSSPLLTSVSTYVSFPGVGEFYISTLNTATLPKDTTIYMRYYVNDGDQNSDTEMPRTDLPDVYKTFWSFWNPS